MRRPVSQKVAALVRRLAREGTAAPQQSAGRILGVSQNTVSKIAAGVPTDYSLSTAAAMVAGTSGLDESERITWADLVAEAELLRRAKGAVQEDNSVEVVARRSTSPPGPRETGGGRKGGGRGHRISTPP